MFGRRACTVVERTTYGPYVVVDVHDPDGPAPAPGQFYMLAAVDRWGGGDGERPFLPRAFSVLRARDGRLSFLFDDVGPGTNRLMELDREDELWLTGPLGEGWRPTDRRPVLIGGGVGIAPLAALADTLDDPDGAARLPRRAPRPGRRAGDIGDSPHAASRPTTARRATTGSSPSCCPTI